MIRSSVLIESGTGKSRGYRVTPEFENVEPPSKKLYIRHVSKYKPTIDVYKMVLEGKNLDRLDAPEDVKDLIRLYERHKSLSAWQLFEKFGVSTWLTTELRRLAKTREKRHSSSPYEGDSVTPSKNEKRISEETVTEVYRQVLAGEKLASINVREDVKNIIRKFSKYSTLSACQISEKTGISTRIIGDLRRMSRINRRRKDQYAEYDRFGVPYAVTQLLKGKNIEYLKLHNVHLNQ